LLRKQVYEVLRLIEREDINRLYAYRYMSMTYRMPSVVLGS